MIYWFNKRLKKDYTIDIGNKKVDIINIFENELYVTIYMVPLWIYIF